MTRSPRRAWRRVLVMSLKCRALLSLCVRDLPDRWRPTVVAAFGNAPERLPTAPNARRRPQTRYGGRSLPTTTAVRFAAASPDGDPTEAALRQHTVVELRERLRAAGLPTSGRKAELVARLAGASGGVPPREGRARRPPPPKRKRKIVVNPNWKKEFDAGALAAAFDEMAKKEGFDESIAHFADDATFEDDFTEDDYALDLDADDAEFDLDRDEDEDGEEDGGDAPDASSARSMEERLAAARHDASRGRVSAPEELDAFSQSEAAATDFDALRRLGFRREANPFGNDETPRREQFMLIGDAMTCPGCGAGFQKDDERRPGFLPAEKFEVQEKLAAIEEAQKKREKGESAEWSPEDEIDWLLEQAGSQGEEEEEELGAEEMAEGLGLDPEALSRKKVICQRCHGLQNQGKVRTDLRPGWTDEPTLSQEEFRRLLLPLGQKKAVIIALADLFDFSGSILGELDQIAGDNPVILAANKYDLFPSAMGRHRAENWVRRELEHREVRSLANVGGAVQLVSCKTGVGVNRMLDKAKALADDRDCDIYVVGAANAGKSTLVNHILDAATPKRVKFGGKKRAGNANKWKGSVTTSPLPGTTLKFIKINLGGGRFLYDTPGLLVPGCLTERLTPKELAIAVPKKQVEPITFRISAGKCALVGGLARIEVTGDSKPFLFTFFVANGVKLHLTDASRADDFTARHAGEMLVPPLAPGPERLAEIGEFEYHDITVRGDGWKTAAADIALRGLGWVAVTGAGTASVRIGVPRGVGVSVRPPLMPFDVWEATAKYTGGRAVRKSGKSRSGKRRKGVGRN